MTLDAGPMAKSGAVTIGHSETNVNLTSLVASLFSSGAAGDGTTITSVAGASLVNGQVLYTPPASGSPNFSYTVTDSLGQTATNTVDVTVELRSDRRQRAADVRQRRRRRCGRQHNAGHLRRYADARQQRRQRQGADPWLALALSEWPDCLYGNE